MDLMRKIILLGYLLLASNVFAGTPDFQSKYYAIGFNQNSPSVNYFSVDSLGRGNLEKNPILNELTTQLVLKLVPRSNGWFYYYDPDSHLKKVVWKIHCMERKLHFISQYDSNVKSVPFVLQFDQKANATTMLGVMLPGQRRMNLPAILHMPDMGSVRITSNLSNWELDYDASRAVEKPFFTVTLPAATVEHPQVEYTFETTVIYPSLH